MTATYWYHSLFILLLKILTDTFLDNHSIFSQSVVFILFIFCRKKIIILYSPLFVVFIFFCSKKYVSFHNNCTFASKKNILEASLFLPQISLIKSKTMMKYKIITTWNWYYCIWYQESILNDLENELNIYGWNY